MINKHLLTIFVLAALVTTSTSLKAQDVKVTNGPELANNEDINMNRMIDGDANSFYCYRVRSKGRGTSFYVEKYDKKTLKPDFSKEISYGEGAVKLEDVLYANGSVYIFTRMYDKESHKMTCYYQTVSSSGTVSNNKLPLVTVSSDHYEFIDFDISMNPAATKFLIKASHKPDKEGAFTTDFTLVNTDGMKTEWTKTIQGRLFSGRDVSGMASVFGSSKSNRSENDCLGIILDDQDNILYGYKDITSAPDDKVKRWKLKMGFFPAGGNKPNILELPFDDSFYIKDIAFHKTKANEVVIAGFLKDITERPGRDLVDIGIFSFTVDLTSMAIKSHPIKIFDNKILAALESKPNSGGYYDYKIDYIFPIGDAVYFVGEQYSEFFFSANAQRTPGSTLSITPNYGARMPMGRAGTMNSHWEYMYKDVIVAKLGSSGQFDWVSNAPLRNFVNINYPHVFKQYFAVATPKNIYIFNNDHPKNIERYQKADFEPKDLKDISKPRGSVFVFSSISTSDGAVKHKLIQANDEYCFTPIQERNTQFMPPEEAEIFVPGDKNEVLVYTEYNGKDRFSRLTIVE